MWHQFHKLHSIRSQQNCTAWGFNQIQNYFLQHHSAPTRSNIHWSGILHSPNRHTIRGLQITCIHTLKIIKPGLHSHIHAENLFLHVSAPHRQTREVISFPFQNRSNHSTFEKAQPRPGRPYQSCQLPSILKSK